MQSPDGSLSVQVLRKEDGSELPVLVHNGTPYIIAEPGTVFTIKTTRAHRDRFSLNVQTRLDVDRRGCGYNMLLKGSKSETFDGFLVNRPADDYDSNGGSTASTYQEFMFAKPDAVGGGNAAAAAARPTVQTLDEIDSGRLSVAFYNVRSIGALTAPVTVAAPPPPPTSWKLPDGKKFFLAPSLETAAGRKVEQSMSWSREQWQSIGGPIWTFEARYETASTLMLRQMLDLDNPQHRALLADSRDPLVTSLLAPPPPRGGGGKRARDAAAAADDIGAGTSAGVGDACVKRERGDGGGAAGFGDGDLVDLSGVPSTALPVSITLDDGRVVARDEVAVCDLAGSDDDDGEAAAPKWDVRKRGVEAVP